MKVPQNIQILHQKTVKIKNYKQILITIKMGPSATEIPYYATGRGVPSNSIRTLTFRWSRAVRRHRRKALPRQPWSRSPDGHYAKTTYALQKTSVSTRHRSSRRDEHAERWVRGEMGTRNANESECGEVVEGE
ncbi:unnamed protein product [Aphis gossypii]|uniref:Uncharacterized protein n=1 Tax=Aphis gossypii TaxID=80765 RepID=A0A9P0ITB0_APHGO|nr:unnamed protein product [Aphis gossypii]